MLIATDGSKNSQRAAEVGIEMAKLYGAAITALYVVDVGKEYAPIGDLAKKIAEDIIIKNINYLKEQGEEATSLVEKMAKKADVSVEKKIVEGYPAEEIIRMAKENNMDFIVVGGIGATGVERFLLGSVADKVVRNSKIPVLVVRKS